MADSSLALSTASLTGLNLSQASVDSVCLALNCVSNSSLSLLYSSQSLVASSLATRVSSTNGAALSNSLRSLSPNPAAYSEMVLRLYPATVRTSSLTAAVNDLSTGVSRFSTVLLSSSTVCSIPKPLFLTMSSATLSNSSAILRNCSISSSANLIDSPRMSSTIAASDSRLNINEESVSKRLAILFFKAVLNTSAIIGSTVSPIPGTLNVSSTIGCLNPYVSNILVILLYA